MVACYLIELQLPSGDLEIKEEKYPLFVRLVGGNIANICNSLLAIAMYMSDAYGFIGKKKQLQPGVKQLDYYLL